jgi:hypothetical protein
MDGKRAANGVAISRRSVLGATGGALLGASLAGLLQRRAETPPADASQAEPSFVGLWRSSAPGGQAMGAAIYSLNLPDGSFVALYPDPRVASVGRWLQTGERTFTVTVYQYRRNADGAAVGLTKVLVRADLNEGGDRWTGTFTSTNYDADGAVVGTTQGMSEGVRLEAEP